MLKRLFSIEDFFDIGERYGIDYHFPLLSSCRERAKEKRIVVQGDVEEMTLSSGICLTNSNVRVLQPYESMLSVLYAGGAGRSCRAASER